MLDIIAKHDRFIKESVVFIEQIDFIQIIETTIGRNKRSNWKLM